MIHIITLLFQRFYSAKCFSIYLNLTVRIFVSDRKVRRDKMILQHICSCRMKTRAQTTHTLLSSYFFNHYYVTLIFSQDVLLSLITLIDASIN